MIQRVAFVAILAALAAGCATSPASRQGPAGTVEQSSLETVRAKITEDKLFEAYQDLSVLERNRPDLSQVATLKEQVVQAFGREFRASVDAGRIEAAASYFCTLLGLGKTELLQGWTPASFLTRLARSKAAEGDAPVALVLALRALQAGQADEGLLRLLMELAAKLGNRSVFQEAAQSLKDRGFAIPGDLEGKIPVLAPVEKLVRGTVTIWVNRGIKIERGVGYPDRVIGSGFFIDPRGYLLTNYHVISSEVDPKYEGYSRLYIKLSERSEEKIPAKVVGYDRIFDLALVKAEVEPSVVFSPGEDAALPVGSRITAIGSPAGLENSVTSGIVSATGRRFLQLGNVIQVDVPINYGNSGGPLLDQAGRLIGIVFAGIEQFEGVNFAIPMRWVSKVLPQLYAGGEVIHPWLGLALQESDQGLKVIYTMPGSPAALAGIQEGDLIKSLNGRPYTKLEEAQAAILDLVQPCLVSVVWERGGNTLRGVLGLAERPFIPIETALEKDVRENVFYPLFGLKVEKTGRFLWQTSYVVKDVVPGSVADETGLSKGDPLTVQGWKMDQENHVAVLVLVVKKRKLGFLESAIQMPAYTETNNFL